MNIALTYSDVFVPGGFPKFTYNPRGDLQLEERLKDAVDNLPKLTVVTGHTKSGKTVLVRKIVPQENSIWIDGGSVTSKDDFWESVVQQLGIGQTVTSTSTQEGGRHLPIGTLCSFSYTAGIGHSRI